MGTSKPHNSRYKLCRLAPASCVLRFFTMGKVYPNKASFSLLPGVYLVRCWEPEGGGEPPSRGGGIASSEKSLKSLSRISLWWNCHLISSWIEKFVVENDLDNASQCQTLKWRSCTDRCVFIPEHICLPTSTNMFQIDRKIHKIPPQINLI